MKFSKHYEITYKQLPDSWPLFINYKILKKSIRNIVAELENKGFLINTREEDAGDSGCSGSKDGDAESVRGEQLVDANYVIKGPVDELRPAIELSVLSDNECVGNEEATKGCNATEHVSTYTVPRKFQLGNAPDGPHSKLDAANAANKSSQTWNLCTTPTLTRRWTYNPITTSKEYAEFLSRPGNTGHTNRGGHASGPGKLGMRWPIGSDELSSSKRRSVRTSVTPSPPEISTTPFTIAGLLSATSNFNGARPEHNDEVRVIVPITKKIIIKRPVLLRCLSFDSIAHKRVNLRQEISSDSCTNKGRLFVELDLESDVVFLKDLYNALTKVAEFESRYSANTVKRARKLLNQILIMGSPFGGDLKHWKWIINFYIDCSVWFRRTGEVKASESSKESLDLFEKISAERKKYFRRKESRDVYDDFINLNRDLLSARIFDEINTTAIRKILKKHDRHTQLNASSTFMSLIKNSSSFPVDIIREMICNIYESLVTVIPLPFNYTCPVCQELYWRPIRLTCNHVFCLRCLSKSQAQGLRDCPLCRHKNAVALACDRNYDKALANFLKLYFPKEVREKGRLAKKEKAMEESRMLKLSVLKTSQIEF